jgi:hypothetical protein
MSLTFIIEDGKERLSSHSGLALIGTLMDDTRLKDRLSQVSLRSCAEPAISHGDVACSMIGLLCLGKPDFAAIEPFRQDPFFVQSLGLDTCPSSVTLRQRLDMVGSAFDAIVKEESAKLLRERAPKLVPVSTSVGERIPVDVDVSPFDNSKTQKEGVSKTYKGYDGYAPILAYLGQEGYQINVELREGKQHCQAGTPDFLCASLGYAKQITRQRVLVRLDAGNDSLDNIKVCLKAKVDWIIKRNLRKESPDTWLALAKHVGTSWRPRKGKTIWRGETFREVPEVETRLRIVFQVTERTSSATGQLLLLPEIEVETYWTSLTCPVKEVIDVYHDHGTSEQFHSEIKSDMDLERLPSGSFATNAVILLLGLFAYNALRICGQESLQDRDGQAALSPTYRRKAERRRLRTVMQDLIYLACRVISHARTWKLSFGRYCPWAGVWKRLYQTFTCPSEQGKLVALSP